MAHENSQQAQLKLHDPKGVLFQFYFLKKLTSLLPSSSAVLPYIFFSIICLSPYELLAK